jgi:hypothetical protein
MAFIALCAMIVPSVNANGLEAHKLYLPTKEGSGLWGMLDDTGQLTIPPIYQSIRRASNASGFPVAVQARDGSWGYVAGSGEVLVEPTLQEARSMTEDGIARYKKDGKWGFLRADGSYLSPPEYTEVSHFSHGLAAVKEGDTWHYIDASGKRAFAGDFAQSQGFSAPGVAPVAKKAQGRLGFINRQGEWVVKPSYDELRRSSKAGHFAARVNQKWGIVDSSGKWIVDPQYYQFGYFDEGGIAEIRVGFGHGGVISDDGDLLLDLEDIDYSHLYYSGKCDLVHYQGYAPVVFYNASNGEPLAKLNDQNYRLASDINDECQMLVLHTGTDGWAWLHADGTQSNLDDEVLEPYFDEKGGSSELDYTDSQFVPVVLRDRSLAYVDGTGSVVLRAQALIQKSQEVLVVRDASGSELWRQAYPPNTLIPDNEYPVFFNKGPKEFNYTPPSEAGLLEKVEWLQSQEPASLFEAEKNFAQGSEYAVGAGIPLANANFDSDTYWYVLDHPRFSSEFKETKSVLDKMYGPVSIDSTIEKTFDLHDIYYYEQDIAAWRLGDRVLLLESYFDGDGYECCESGLNLILLPTAESMLETLALPIVPLETVSLAPVSDDDVAAMARDIDFHGTQSSIREAYDATLTFFSYLEEGKKVSLNDYILVQYVLLGLTQSEDSAVKVGSQKEAFELARLLIKTIEANGLGDDLLTAEGQLRVEAYLATTNYLAWEIGESDPAAALQVIEPAVPYLKNYNPSEWDTYVRVLLGNGQQEKAFAIIKRLLLENPWHEYLITFYEDEDYQKWAKSNDAPLLEYEEILTEAFSVLEEQEVAVSRKANRLAVFWFSQISVFDLTTGEKQFTVDAKTYAPFVFRFSHDGSKLVASGWDFTSVWDASNGKLLSQEKTPDHNSELAGVSANGKHYYYTTSGIFGDQSLWVRKMGSNSIKTTQRNVEAGKNSFDDNYLVVSIYEQDEPLLNVIDLNKAKVVASLRGDQADNYDDDMFFVNNNKQLLVRDYDDFYLWDLASEKVEASWNTGGFDVDQIAVNDELVLVVDGENFSVRSWGFSGDPEDAVELALPETARGLLGSVTLSESGQYYALVSSNKDENLVFAFVIDVKTNKIINQYITDNPFLEVTFVNNDQHLLIEGYPITLIETKSAKPVYEISR